MKEISNQTLMNSRCYEEKNAKDLIDTICHPNIIKCFDQFYEGDYVYFIYEYCEV